MFVDAIHSRQRQYAPIPTIDRIFEIESTLTYRSGHDWQWQSATAGQQLVSAAFVTRATDIVSLHNRTVDDRRGRHQNHSDVTALSSCSGRPFQNMIIVRQIELCTVSCHSCVCLVLLYCLHRHHGGSTQRTTSCNSFGSFSFVLSLAASLLIGSALVYLFPPI